MTHDFAVFSEYSNTDKKMKKNANTRVFNTIEVPSIRGNIELNMTNGVITLHRGVYHITAVSIVAPYYPKTDTDGRVTDNPRPYGGYCRLRYKNKAARDDTPIALGTISNANMLPSMVDTFLRVEKKAQIVLDHQNGADVKDLYLQINVANSTWHIFARISIQKLE